MPLLSGVSRPHPASGEPRWAVIYSPIDIHCGLDGHFCAGCYGYEPRDARAIAGNVILYAFLQRRPIDRR